RLSDRQKAHTRPAPARQGGALTARAADAKEPGKLPSRKPQEPFMRKLMLGAALALVSLTGAASAQNFPARQLTMVIPFAAGGPTDVLGRVLAARMGELLGQTVIVENVGGAGGMTGSAKVAQARPDGYTMVLGTVGTHAQGQTLYKKPLYNAATDFTP